MSLTPDLIAAARFERDRRAQSYPQKIFDGQITAEQAAIDYQCWVAIVEWAETERFSSFHGGADPQGPEAPIIRFADLAVAAKKAVNAVERKLAGEAWFDGCPPTPTSERRGALVRLHRAIQLRSESIDAINAEFRAQRVRGTGEHETPEGVPPKSRKLERAA